MVAEVGSSGFGRGLVILTCTNCRSAAIIASAEMAKPPITTAKTWSTLARFRPNSHGIVVCTGSDSLMGSISWQFSGRKWLNSGML